MKSFSNWTIVEVEKEFQVKQQYDYHLLDSWLEPADRTPSSTDALKDLQTRLIKHIYNWNEQELKVRFMRLPFSLSLLPSDLFISNSFHFGCKLEVQGISESALHPKIFLDIYIWTFI